MLTNIWALFVNPTFVWGIRARDPRVAGHRCLVMLAVSAWYLRKERHVESFHRTAKVALIVADPDDRDPAVGRQQARRDRGRVSADEDRGGRGAVEQLQAVLVLGGSDRGLQQQQRDRDEDHRDPASAVGPGDRHLERPGHRAQPAPGAVSEEVRARQLHPERGDPVLVDADHGGAGIAGVAAGAVGRLAAAARDAAKRRGCSCGCRCGR